METKKTNFTLVSLVALGMFMVMLSSVQAKADGRQLKETKLSFYVHDFSAVGSPNATDLPVFGIPGKFWRFDQFGTIYVFDDLITEGPELTSAKVGRVQGTGITVSLEGRNALISCSLVFTNKAYNGSTIQVLGVINQFNRMVEYGVTSGTGKFRYATGYVTKEILSFDPSTYSLLRVNTTIRHY